MFAQVGWKVLLTAAIGIILFSQPFEAQSNVGRSKEHFERARSYSAAGDPRAEQEYHQAIKASGGVYPEAWQRLSSYLAQELRFDEAASAFRKYLRQTRQKTQRSELDRLFRLDRGAELKARSERKDPLSADEMIELTRLVDAFGRKGSAVLYAEKAVEQHPESAKALVSLAELIKWEQKDRALELLTQAVSFEPNEPAMYTARGWCYFWAHGNPLEAEADFRKAIELSKGSNASAWAGLGDSLAREGRREEAIVAYRKYLAIRPKAVAHHDGAIRKSIEMLEATGNHPQR